MLVNKNNSNILPLAREVLKRPLDSRRFGFLVYHEEVPLGVRGVGDMLPSNFVNCIFLPYSCVFQNAVRWGNIRRYLRVGDPLRSC